MRFLPQYPEITFLSPPEYGTLDIRTEDISLHNVILGGNDHVENEQDHPLVRADRGAGDVHCAVYSAKRPIEDTAYRNAGKTYAESQQPGDETPVITGGDFTITATRLKTCARKTVPPA